MITDPTPSAEDDHVVAADDLDGLTYFSDDQACTVEALTGRLIPGSPDDPGAIEAGVVYYIDRTVAGFSSDLQLLYRQGIAALNTFCAREFGSPFAGLGEQPQDEVIGRFLDHPHEAAAGVDGREATAIVRLLAVVREHTIEGFFCDPVYGGNRGAVGWRLVGFPGAYWGYSEDQMGRGFDGHSLPIKTLADLRSQLRQEKSSVGGDRPGKER
ncbi:gluconate 2-dehydrogenase subunit 3 family protein [Microlunatus soli]|uniref:Gluconate 2-dehydrogenase gamma chain n=1 Tax=Microlunatus soli TaxID=630515 RepID=A0A1H1Q0M5_9ACTN|nr:gluconate 2-dehydrogenase subunit 3 family protein [Microlunatus soli]SDS17032.1 gluconate 2-dehydrogenase gamma chain [Microlunatus soli]